MRSVNRIVYPLAACLALALSSTQSYAQTVAIPLFNTGVDNSKALLPGGSVDPHYTVLDGSKNLYTSFNPGGTSAVESQSSLFSGWTANGPASKWISTNDSSTNPIGTFYFKTTFDLTGLSPSTATISGQWTVDDSSGQGILLNGVAIPGTTIGSGAWGSFQSFTIPVGSNFVSGVNTLLFETDFTDAATNAVRVDNLSGTAKSLAAANTPEPGSIALLAGLGFSGGLFLKRRKK